VVRAESIQQESVGKSRLENWIRELELGVQKRIVEEELEVSL
jgi:hypothetical protein